ncbi:hypothetical protein K6119_05255 [Paracrocinitomix mangrovi]|uniref:hypothetical protein n=1 Tax=Paracrocinitomix mangrovi TaxID=2862509 RepID=UPI001C8D4452|nr:hypothetical protein [Paracrocinitomix mangrovi]UKN02921.1 hypothetical protein K6119_05255 [Paracrocinitomix mangrovi]
MKTIITSLALLISSIAYLQTDSSAIKSRDKVKIERKISPAVYFDRAKKINSIYGNFEVEKYTVLSKNTLNTTELNLIVGSLIKVQDSTMTGAEIDPMTYQIYEVEMMTSDDYIFRVFGKEVKEPQPEELPSTLKVHKTDNKLCYGIVELPGGKIAVPYKGVLLFLVPK